MRAQTEQAVEDADLAFLMIDARAGVTPLDEHFSQWLRRASTPVFLLANKCEGKQGESGLMDAYRLPRRVFDQTDIQTDIVVFKKKKS